MFSNIGLENDVRQLEVNCDTYHLDQVKEREIYALPLVFFFPFSFLPPLWLFSTQHIFNGAPFQFTWAAITK